jgi:Cu/Ag efflux protein CusF
MKMIKRLFTFSLVLLFSSLGQAAVTSHRLNPVEFLSVQRTISGEVVSVDSGKHEVVIKDSAGNQGAIVVNESTKLTKGGKAASLADLKAGDKVAVEADEAGGKLVAKSIAVTE